MEARRHAELRPQQLAHTVSFFSQLVVWESDPNAYPTDNGLFIDCLQRAKGRQTAQERESVFLQLLRRDFDPGSCGVPQTGALAAAVEAVRRERLVAVMMEDITDLLNGEEAAMVCMH